MFGLLMEADMNMTLDNFAKLAGAVFVLVALVQLVRAFTGFQMMAGTMMVPVWASWVAFLVFALLAWLAFTAKRS